MAKNTKKSSRNRKWGRNRDRSPSIARYRGENRIERNRIKRLNRHLKRFPYDLCAQRALGYSKYDGTYRVAKLAKHGAIRESSS